MNARALIWEAWPRKPAASLQYELNLRGHRVSYRQSKRIADTGAVPRQLWGDFIDILDTKMAKRSEQISEAERQIKLARLERNALAAAARMAQVERQSLQEIPLPLKE